MPVLIPLFVNAFRRADELAFALDARCYNATENRTKYKVQKIKGSDIVGILVVGGYLALVIVDKYVFGGLF